MPILLKNLTAPDLQAALAPLGVSLRLARRLQAAAIRRDEVPASLPEVSGKLLEQIRGETRLPRLVQLEKITSARDGFAKYLFRGDGPEPFEAVRIPLLHRAGDEKAIACVGSQVGCSTNTSLPRTFSSSSTLTSPSENRPTVAEPREIPRRRVTSAPSLGLALPVKTIRLPWGISATPSAVRNDARIFGA